MNANLITEWSDYLINKFKSNVSINTFCECCGKEYLTNINRTRCSKKCSKIMKHRRRNINSLFSVKYEKQTMLRTNINLFGFVTRYIN